MECELEDEEQVQELREVSEEPDVRMYGLVGGRNKETDKDLVRLVVFFSLLPSYLQGIWFANLVCLVRCHVKEKLFAICDMIFSVLGVLRYEYNY